MNTRILSNFMLSIFILALTLSRPCASAEESLPPALAAFRDYQKRVTADWKSHQELVQKKWGSASESAGVKVFVDYTADADQMLKVDYEKGEILIESVGPSHSSESSLKALDLATRPGTSGEPAPLQREDIELPALPPVPVRIAPVEGQDGVVRERMQVRIPLKADHLERRMKRVRPEVQRWAGRFKLSEPLVLAVIRQESAFNPRARSHIPAYGLMQIVPKYAGAEVASLFKDGARLNTPEALYQPEPNILVGTTYLHRLMNFHLARVSDPVSRKYCAIASYNWGPSRVLRAIQNGHVRLDLGPERVYQDLRQVAPAETRDYLEKVRGYEVQYSPRS
jgi:membrane-bound lytic murein transglycosylase C